MACRVNSNFTSDNQWKPQESDHQKTLASNNQWRLGSSSRIITNEAKMNKNLEPPDTGFVSSSTSEEPVTITCLESQRPSTTNWPNQPNYQAVYNNVNQHDNYAPFLLSPNSILRNSQNVVSVHPASSSTINLSPPSYANALDRYIPNGAIFDQPQLTPSRPAPRNHVKKPKRQRTAITTEQIMNLENEYKKNRYIEKFRRMQLSHMLCINERVIKIWFQNRRMKEKNENAARVEDDDDVYDVPYIPPSQSDWVAQNPHQNQERSYQNPQNQSCIYPGNNSFPHDSTMMLVQQIDSTVYMLHEVPQYQSQEIQYGYEEIL